MAVKRIWQGILVASGVVGAIFVIVEQGRRVADWTTAGLGVSREWAAAAYYGIGSIGRRAATAVAEAYHRVPVCMSSVATADLDRDGHATDLIVRYTDQQALAAADAPMTCDDYAETGSIGEFRERFMVAKRSGSSHVAAAQAL
jgi:hypothetical protein